MQNAPMTALLPDALVMFAVVVAWLNDTFVGQAGRRTTYFIAFFSTLVAGVWFALNAFDPQVRYFFGHMDVVDPFASAMKAVVSLGYAVSIVYSRRYLEDRGSVPRRVLHAGHVLAARQLVMISGNNFLTLYLGLELMSLSLYALIALRRDDAAVDRSGDEVLRARRAGQRLPAVRPVDDVRRDRLARHERSVQGDRHEPLRSERAAVRPGLHRRRPGVQARRGAVPHVGARRLPGRADGGDAADRRRARSWPPSRPASASWSRACCRWRSTGSRCWWCWRCCR